MYTQIALGAIQDLDGQVLKYITQLKKVVNSSLLGNITDDKSHAKSVKSLDLATLVGSSVKIACLVSILEHVVKASGEGLVLVSNYTT
jgi:chemotaxis regulatin CheY-phosphate phosphatase CheZ